jgi:hypothetical protein
MIGFHLLLIFSTLISIIFITSLSIALLYLFYLINYSSSILSSIHILIHAIFYESLYSTYLSITHLLTYYYLIIYPIIISSDLY